MKLNEEITRIKEKCSKVDETTDLYLVYQRQIAAKQEIIAAQERQIAAKEEQIATNRRSGHSYAVKWTTYRNWGQSRFHCLLCSTFLTGTQ